MIIILTILLTFAIVIIGSLITAIKDIAEFIIEENPQWVVDDFFKKHGKECYDCSVLFTFQENMGFNGTVYDFSKYEDCGIVMMTECFKGIDPQYTDFKDAEGVPYTSLVPNQRIWLLDDGSYRWDPTPAI